MSNLYVVVGASGNTGKVVAEGLLKAGKRVRVVGRDAGRLAAFKQQGAEVASGDLQDAKFVAKAFAGASYAYVMVPPDLSIARGFRDYQKKVAANLVNAVQQAGLSHVVTLSSVGAHLPSGNGPVAGLHDMEKAFAELKGLHVLHLRPGFFMENLLGQIGLIKSQGINGSPAKADLPMILVATRDIAKVALTSLVELDFKGHTVRELLGPREVTWNQVTKLFGKAIGKSDLAYVQFPYADAIKGMVGMGIPEERANMYVEMYKGFNEGTIKPTQARGPNTNTPTTLEWFVEHVWAPAYQAAK